jgi:hypothetical protein
MWFIRNAMAVKHCDSASANAVRWKQHVTLARISSKSFLTLQVPHLSTSMPRTAQGKHLAWCMYCSRHRDRRRFDLHQDACFRKWKLREDAKKSKLRSKAKASKVRRKLVVVFFATNFVFYSMYRMIARPNS